jgi:hypothetical protein
MNYLSNLSFYPSHEVRGLPIADACYTLFSSTVFIKRRCRLAGGSVTDLQYEN